MLKNEFVYQGIWVFPLSLLRSHKHSLPYLLCAQEADIKLTALWLPVGFGQREA